MKVKGRRTWRWCEDGDHLGFNNLLVVNNVSGETATVLFSLQLLLIPFNGGSVCVSEILVAKSQSTCCQNPVLKVDNGSQMTVCTLISVLLSEAENDSDLV